MSPQLQKIENTEESLMPQSRAKARARRFLLNFKHDDFSLSAAVLLGASSTRTLYEGVMRDHQGTQVRLQATALMRGSKRVLGANIHAKLVDAMRSDTQRSTIVHILTLWVIQCSQIILKGVRDICTECQGTQHGRACGRVPGLWPIFCWPRWTFVWPRT